MASLIAEEIITDSFWRSCAIVTNSRRCKYRPLISEILPYKQGDGVCTKNKYLSLEYYWIFHQIGSMSWGERERERNCPALGTAKQWPVGKFESQ